MNARTIGTLAGLGGFTAAVALLTGLSAARADDQSDGVRQRIDQLAQATQGGANPSGYVDLRFGNQRPRQTLIKLQGT